MGPLPRGLGWTGTGASGAREVASETEEADTVVEATLKVVRGATVEGATVATVVVVAAAWEEVGWGLR